MELPTPDDLKERRKELGLTQAELADRAGVSQPLIARIEGSDVDPRLSTLRSIVEALEEVEGDIVRAADLMHTNVVSVSPDDSVAEAIDIMGEAGYSQLPVISDGYPEGMISNADVRHKGLNADPKDLPVEEVKSDSVTTVEPGYTLDQVESRLDLEENKAVIVVGDRGVEGIITEADVAARFS
jgi:predicted transcriptional regulator